MIASNMGKVLNETHRIVKLSNSNDVMKSIKIKVNIICCQNTDKKCTINEIIQHLNGNCSALLYSDGFKYMN